MKRKKIKVWRRKRASPKRGFGKWRLYVISVEAGRPWYGYSLVVLARSRREAERLVYTTLDGRIVWEDIRAAQDSLMILDIKPQAIVSRWGDW